MPARISAFVVWAFAAAVAVFWGLRLGVRPLAAPPGTPVAVDAVRPTGDWTRLLGPDARTAPAAAAPVAESSRFRLLGVVAQGAGGTPRGGVALLAVDGKPPRAWRVGARIDGDLVLKSVSRRGVQIGPLQGPATVSLELPPPAPPATGALPQIGPDGSPVSPMPFPPAVPPPGAAPMAVPPPQPVPPIVPGMAPPMPPPSAMAPPMAPLPQAPDTNTN